MASTKYKSLQKMGCKKEKYGAQYIILHHLKLFQNYFIYCDEIPERRHERVIS
jgi:hypothetical protein